MCKPRSGNWKCPLCKKSVGSSPASRSRHNKDHPTRKKLKPGPKTNKKKLMKDKKEADRRLNRYSKKRKVALKAYKKAIKKPLRKAPRTPKHAKVVRQAANVLVQGPVLSMSPY